ncbi:2-amino-4-hydroxy-6-hydroxymethyldihydropteridine diphosphokinase [Acinetobacter rathckeae]|uniref:2-amino-4-hydroxy-6- hydroxymethyldihydropteridine diphosphokinase n=1 Tax=Acinetobacter rathckeae TaxID=2605272 RepID=UPI0018A3360F|nr:2-amino-4-hydroxy-6-hydroxymethyldihydropteridine diphosphokinase [Acinetobacter rathckeae]MBF7686667.1 2-amino-4-hydroxy-6-hydroxymethyldihydropteridine diphosphokinase [Acinetobacter rathckeae]MBF7696484.1 2-amino-4-hydroxy-6-hydroxymethyldihydropteridine diphosphokinase [Acinetobacter rathckeae]
MHITYIGLGSNLGDSRHILCQAVAQLATLGTINVSQLYSTPPMGPQDQPDYLNAVVELKTTLKPLALLDALQAFEQQSGRVRLRRWGERTLDLDLLWYDDQNLKCDRLTVPHIGLLERDFVLLPLLDLNPEMVVQGTLLKALDVVKHSTLVPIATADWFKQNIQ